MTNRTITEDLLERLQAQADEADIIGETKLADIVTNQIQKTAIRKNDDFYSYASIELKNDIESLLWQAALRVADFNASSLDIIEVQKSIESFANNFIEDFTVQSGITHGVGAYEPVVPGEEKQHVLFQIEEKE